MGGGCMCPSPGVAVGFRKVPVDELWAWCLVTSELWSQVPLQGLNSGAQDARSEDCALVP